ncbi:MAG TPA: tetratricopeptide repeat protein [Terracidiphilus sp.]|jgi:tetratricopeptide (TPR) repeat protein|nr:tetratricopeptide repeat protein [Terracidiphilus sp.]
MKRLLMTLIALGLVASAAAWATPDVPSTDKQQFARIQESKGDQARARGSNNEAVYYYRSAVRINPNTVLFNKLGVAEIQAGDRSSARKHLNQAVKLDPQNVSAFNNLGVLACVERKYNQAVRYLKQALALQETNAAAHLNMAEAWFGLGEVDRAMTEYARALELDADILTSSPGSAVAHVGTPEQRGRVDFTIAKAYAKRGNIEGALEYLRRAKEAHYSDLAKVYTDQTFAALWEDPRLEKIVKR